MITTLVISILTCVLLILSILLFPKLKIKNVSLSTFWMVALIGGILILSLGCISLNEVKDSLFASSEVNPFKILILFFSMTFLSIYLDELNFFKFLASKASKKANNSQLALFFILYLLVSILTIFTSNDIVILTFTPFICYFCKNAKINPLPYIVSEFAAANTYSMILIIGNPTNIYLATSANIDFISYLKVMLIPTLLAGLVELLIIYILFRKQLKTPISYSNDEEIKIDNLPNLIIGISSLGVCLILLVISSYIHLEMWLISLGCALSLLISIIISNLIQKRKLTNVFNTLKRLPYELIPFMLSMFVIVLALNKNGISQYISSFLGEDHLIIKYGTTSFISANLINNIPMSVLFATLPTMSDQVLRLQAIYATIVGSNIGAFLTPLGALAGIMFTSLLNKYEVKYNFLDFIKYGLIISIPTLLVALFSLNLFI